MKKGLLIMLLCALLLQTAACGEIDMESGVSYEDSAASSDTDSGTDADSDNVGEWGDISLPADDSDSESEVQDSFVTDDTTEDSRPEEGSGSEIIVDSDVSDPVLPTYNYAIDLSDEEISCIEAGTDGEFLALVNKTHLLASDYVPDNLVEARDTRTDREKKKLVYTAEVALHAFLKEAAYYGYDDITVTSAYRSYSEQKYWFNYYVQQEMASGKDKASAEAAAATYSAYPGTSEHQTGLCVDMHNLPSASQTFGSTEAAKWLAANAHRFGFILRFPSDKEEITTYMWEPWHFRFVGVYHATRIYEQGLCLEEYHESLDGSGQIWD